MSASRCELCGEPVPVAGEDCCAECVERVLAAEREIAAGNFVTLEQLRQELDER